MHRLRALPNGVMATKSAISGSASARPFQEGVEVLIGLPPLLHQFLDAIFKSPQNGGPRQRAPQAATEGSRPVHQYGMGCLAYNFNGTAQRTN